MIKMQQYQLPKESDFENLRFCLDNYQAYWLYIRLKGASGGNIKVSENLEGKKLNFIRNETGLHFLINSDEIFHFPLKDYKTDFQKGFLIEYERTETKGGIERKISQYSEHDLPSELLPEPTSSILRTVLDNHLLEIAFRGKIRLEFHSWWNENTGQKYWKPVK